MLYFVATPIGNLGDMTFRARDTLAQVDFILAEDTRRAGKLLNHLNIRKKLISFHEHSGQAKIDRVVGELKRGKSAALLSDAGTPGLCDPGGKLARAALEKGIKITPVPGASAPAALISVAPFPCSRFVFLGYFPKKKGRVKILDEIKSYQGAPVFFFESPHRIVKTLEHLKKHLNGYDILIGRELTKVFEEVIFCRLKDCNFSADRARGEIVFALVKRDI